MILATWSLHFLLAPSPNKVLLQFLEKLTIGHDIRQLQFDICTLSMEGQSHHRFCHIWFVDVNAKKIVYVGHKIHKPPKLKEIPIWYIEILVSTTVALGVPFVSKLYLFDGSWNQLWFICSTNLQKLGRFLCFAIIDLVWIHTLLTSLKIKYMFKVLLYQQLSSNHCKTLGY